MTIDELIEKLKAIRQAGDWDRESNHIEADKALLEYINDPNVTAAFNVIDKWYS